MKISKKIIALFMVSFFASPASAFEFSCERYSDNWEGFKSKSAMEDVYPKNIDVDATEFSIKSGSKSVFYSDTISGVSVQATLLKDGKLIVVLPDYASYVANARYKCDSNAVEVAEYLETGKAQKSAAPSSDGFEAAWSCGKTLNDVFWSLIKMVNCPKKRNERRRNLRLGRREETNAD